MKYRRRLIARPACPIPFLLSLSASPDRSLSRGYRGADSHLLRAVRVATMAVGPNTETKHCITAGSRLSESAGVECLPTRSPYGSDLSPIGLAALKEAAQRNISELF